VVLDELPEPPGGPEAVLLQREEVRLALVVAFQSLAPKQRAVLLLHDVCGLPLAEAAVALGTNGNAAKATLRRARAGLARARGRADVDPQADADVVERLARALEERSVDALALLLADDVWGIVDGGGVVKVASRPTVGARALLRRFIGLERRVAQPVACRVVRLNGEPAVLVSLPAAAGAVFASVHVETREGRIATMRVVRDPAKLAPLRGLTNPIGARP
jgi:RNA polymerase sigma-70 factor (ECF subfamily)